MRIEKLEWDSDFFDLRIGRIELNDKNLLKSEIENLKQYDLVYIFSNQELNEQFFQRSFTKTEYSFNITNYQHHQSLFNNSIQILSISPSNSDLETLEKLALASGKYSRFRKDENFEEHHYIRLYKMWLANSINNTVADEVLVYKSPNREIKGFITLKLNVDYVRIGLIAVDRDQRGKGIGGRLLEAAKLYAHENECKRVLVATQLENERACSFYEKHAFELIEKIYTYHLWNR